MEQVDAVVIGMGPGGEEVAGRLAEEGLAVVGVDERLVGGECPYYGCVPSKMMIRAADALAEARRIPQLAGTVTVEPDWTPVAERIRTEATDDWDDRVAVERFENKGGRFVRGHGRITGPATVTVGTQEFEARRAIVVNTGTQPAVPPIPGLAGTPFWTNREAIRATEVPASLLVLGGGAIGAELAQVYARFGAAVTVVEAMPHLLPFDEPEAGAVVADVFRREGITVLVGVKAVGVRHDDRAGFTLELDDGAPLTARNLLVATGRRIDITGAGLDVVGVDPSARTVPVDERMRVAAGVWAVGDITGKGAFTHVSMYQAEIAVADILGAEVPPADYRALPRVTFTDPEVASVGMTVAQARDAGLDVLVGRASVAATARGWIHGPGNDGFIQIVADAGRDVCVGATTVGPRGGEVMSALAVAIHGEVPLQRLRHMIYAYPTFHRGILDALRDLRRTR